MIVIATGPRSNGTTLLYEIIESADHFSTDTVRPIHFPAYPPEVIGTNWSEDLTKALFVVSLRDPYVAAQSMLRRGFHSNMEEAIAEQTVARNYLREQVAKLGSRAFVFEYEDLVADPEGIVSNIENFLRDNGYNGKPLTRPSIRDENKKYKRE